MLFVRMSEIERMEFASETLQQICLIRVVVACINFRKLIHMDEAKMGLYAAHGTGTIDKRGGHMSSVGITGKSYNLGLINLITEKIPAPRRLINTILY
jgi:hypothetical protein